jgi:hypothetical protein
LLFFIIYIVMNSKEEINVISTAQILLKLLLDFGVLVQPVLVVRVPHHALVVVVLHEGQVEAERLEKQGLVLRVALL